MRDRLVKVKGLAPGHPHFLGSKLLANPNIKKLLSDSA